MSEPALPRSRRRAQADAPGDHLVAPTPAPLDGAALVPLFALALVYLDNGATARALVVARGLRSLAPDVPSYQALLCACLLATGEADVAEPLLNEMLEAPVADSRELALSTQLLAALVHWHKGRASEGEAALRGYLTDARLC